MAYEIVIEHVVEWKKSESFDKSECWTYSDGRKVHIDKAEQRSQFPTSSFYIALAYSSRFLLWSCIILPPGHQ